jgi:CO dehydrogenase/acetyl-CoA synthase gamma subunit (corrinoid Fe-S protein)
MLIAAYTLEIFRSKAPILEVLKQLPRTNCGECGEKTCMVFATLVAQGVKEMADCPEVE